MTVVLTGSALTLDELVRVTRGGEAVALAPGVPERWLARALWSTPRSQRGDPVYGVTTGVGVLEAGAAGRRRGGELQPASAREPPGGPGSAGRARAREGDHAASRQRLGRRPRRRAAGAGGAPGRGAQSRGTAGRARSSARSASRTSRRSPISPRGLFGDPALAAGEGLALLNNNAFSTAGCRAGRQRRRPAARLPPMPRRHSASRPSPRNLTILHPAIAAAGPDEGLALRSGRLRELLDGSYLWRGREPRATSRTRSPSARCRRCTAPPATPSPTPDAAWPSS